MKHNFYISIFVFLLTLCSCVRYNYSPDLIDKTLEYQSDSNVWVSLNNLERVDEFAKVDNVIFCGEISCDVEPMKGIDISSFKVMPGSRYAKDKNKVYYPLEIFCVDYETCGVCYCSDYIIENASPSTFEYLGKEYARDLDKVYFRGELIENADGETFTVISGPEFFFFAVDKNRVYKHNEIFDKADPETFYFDKNDRRNIDNEFEHKYIIGDKNKEWEYIPPDTINEIEKI